jgi:hypothetical protein
MVPQVDAWMANRVLDLPDMTSWPEIRSSMFRAQEVPALP